nr:hypothetical protein [Tanacetum cinerariifolium]
MELVEAKVVDRAIVVTVAAGTLAESFSLYAPFHNASLTSYGPSHLGPSLPPSSVRLTLLLQKMRSRLIYKDSSFFIMSTFAVLKVGMPISTRIIASVPYVSKNGVSSLLDLIIVRTSFVITYLLALRRMALAFLFSSGRISFMRWAKLVYAILLSVSTFLLSPLGTYLIENSLNVLDASVEDIMNLLRLEGPLANAHGMSDLHHDIEQLKVPIHMSEDHVVLRETSLSFALSVSHSRVEQIRANIAAERSELASLFHMACFVAPVDE